MDICTCIDLQERYEKMNEKHNQDMIVFIGCKENSPNTYVCFKSIDESFVLDTDAQVIMELINLNT